MAPLLLLVCAAALLGPASVIALETHHAPAQAAPQPTPTTTTQEISQYNVTFRFVAPVQAGQYATGDWWIVGPATIAAIDPPSQPSRGRHGWQVNPASPTSQALDSRVADYNASQLPTLPATVQPDDAVVKAVSLPDPIQHSVALDVVVVLSVVSMPPAQDAFRPPYFGTRQSRAAAAARAYTVSQVADHTHLLPNVTATAGAPASTWMLRRFARPQIDWLRGYVSREIHPTSAMPDYGSDILRDAGDAALRLMTPPDSNNTSSSTTIATATSTAATTTKAELAVGYVQWGIDSFGVLQGGGSWGANGGHENGRKIVMVMTALLLGDDDMSAAIRGTTPCLAQNCTFSEDGELIGHPLHSNITLWGGDVGDERAYWTLVTDAKCDGDRTMADPYGWIDGGQSPGAAYQTCCTSSPWKGTALALLLWPAARAVFNDEAFISYVERWMSVGTWAQPDPCAPASGRCTEGGGHCTGNCTGSPCGPSGAGSCVLSMDGYGHDFGPDGHGGCILDGDSSDGIGRFPYRHGLYAGGGDYGSAFQASMWAAYGPPTGQQTRASPGAKKYGH